MERTETPALWRKPPDTEIPVPVATAPAPYSATAQRARPTAARAAGPNRLADACGLEDEPQGRHGEVSPDRRLAGARLSRCGRSTAGGLEECFTINRLDIPRSLHRFLATSNIEDNPHSGVRSRTRRVCRWRAGMAARWSAAAFLEMEKSFRKIMGFRDLWAALKAILDGSQPATRQAVA